MKSQIIPIHGQTLKTQYAYEPDGMLRQITYPSGHVLDYQISQGRIQGMTLDQQPVISQIQYRFDDQPLNWQWGNGLSRQISYDPKGQVSSYSLPVGNEQLQRDVLDNITARIHPNVQHDYQYDALQRLDQVTGGSLSISYQYDANGNRSSETDQGSTTAYTLASNSNQLTGVGGDSFVLDANGSRTSDAQHSYQYDRFNRLTEVDTGIHYQYNAIGQRVSKQIGTDSTRYVYGLNGQLLGEYGSGGKREYLYLQGTPIALIDDLIALDCSGASPQIQPDVVAHSQYYCRASSAITAQPIVVRGQGSAWLQAPQVSLQPGSRVENTATLSIGNDQQTPLVNLYYIHPDHLGTPRVVTDPNQTVIWQWRPRPFGDNSPEQDPDNDGNSFTLNLRMPGQYYDLETGLFYNYFRYYEPDKGRYITSDPIGLDGGLNTYCLLYTSPSPRD